MTFSFDHTANNAITQLCIDYTPPHIWYRGNGRTGWSTWKRFIIEQDLINFLHSDESGEKYDNVDNVPNNTITTFTYQHVKSGQYGTFPKQVSTAVLVMTFTFRPNANNTITQFCTDYGDNTHIWYRGKSSTGWGQWQQFVLNLHNKNFIGIFNNTTITPDNKEQFKVTTVNSQPFNTIVTYSGDFVLADTGNFPERCNTATCVMCYGGLFITNADTEGLTAIVQTAVWHRNGNCCFAVRYKIGNDITLWTKWVELTSLFDNILTTYEKNYIETYNNYVATCVDKPIELQNKTFVVIGDSITTDSHGGYTWGSIIAQKFSATEQNFGVSGASYNTSRGNEGAIITQIKNNQEAIRTADVVFIAAGINDWSIANQPAIFRGYVEEVAKKIDNIQPTGKIIFITPIRCTETPTINAAVPKLGAVISNVALEHNYSVINGYDFPIPTYKSDYFNDLSDGDGIHPNKISKKIYAMSVINAIM